jgi:hypothetical protein
MRTAQRARSPTPKGSELGADVPGLLVWAIHTLDIGSPHIPIRLQSQPFDVGSKLTIFLSPIDQTLYSKPQIWSLHTFLTSVTLIHPEDRVTISIHQAINKCSLFANNPTLTVSPYRVQSPVSLSIFKEFVTALEGKTVNITTTNLIGLEQLCEEFGFSEFSSKVSKAFGFSEASQGRQIGSQLSEVRKGFLQGIISIYCERVRTFERSL